MRRPKHALRVVGCWLVGAGVLVAAACVYGQLRFGSPRALLVVLKGDALLVTPASIDLGEMKFRESREFPVHLCNLSERSVTVAGFRTTCTCMSSSRLPLTLPPRGRGDVVLAMRAGARPRQHATATLYVSGEHTSEISVPVVLRVDMASVPRNDEKSNSGPMELSSRAMVEAASPAQ